MTKDGQRSAVVAAYVTLLGLPHELTRHRLQPVLAGLRDEIAFLDGRSPEDVQNQYEALIPHG